MINFTKKALLILSIQFAFEAFILAQSQGSLPNFNGCSKDERLVCAPIIAGGCNNKICVPDDHSSVGPDVVLAMQSDMITGCGLDKKELAHDPNYKSYARQAVDRLSKYATDECLTDVKRTTRIVLEGICHPNEYFNGQGHIEAWAKFSCSSWRK